MVSLDKGSFTYYVMNVYAWKFILMLKNAFFNWRGEVLKWAKI